MMTKYLTVRVLQLVSLFTVTVGQSCTGRDACSCTLDDGGLVDISSLGNQDNTPKFADNYASDGYYYSYNPCYPFVEGGGCSNAAGCQISGDQSAQYLVGDASTAAYSHDGSNVHVKYTAPTGDGNTRNLDVTLICDQNADPPVFAAQGEQGSLQYFFTLTTKCACSNGCASGPPPPTKKPGPHNDNGGGGGGISPGTILCIVALGLIVMYGVVGVGFMMTVRKARGAEAIPNYGLWKSMPGLIKDGFKFTFGKICSRPGYSKI